MKMFAKWSMILVVGALLMVVSGCQEEKVAPAAAEGVEEAVAAAEDLTAEVPVADAAAEDLAVEEAVTDVPMDHPAH